MNLLMSSREGGKNYVMAVTVCACRKIFQLQTLARHEQASTKKQGVFRWPHLHMNMFSFHDRTVTVASFFA